MYRKIKVQCCCRTIGPITVVLVQLYIQSLHFFPLNSRHWFSHTLVESAILQILDLHNLWFLHVPKFPIKFLCSLPFIPSFLTAWRCSGHMNTVPWRSDHGAHFSSLSNISYIGTDQRLTNSITWSYFLLSSNDYK